MSDRLFTECSFFDDRRVGLTYPQKNAIIKKNFKGMMKMNRAEKAVNIKHQGKNCAQAVLLAYADVLGKSEEELTALGACFGSGMGTMNATCGALCGAQMVQGLLKFSGRSMGAEAKKLHSRFEMLCGSTDCGELKGVKGGRMLCSCDDCVRNAVMLLEAKD